MPSLPAIIAMALPNGTETVILTDGPHNGIRARVPRGAPSCERRCGNPWDSAGTATAVYRRTRQTRGGLAIFAHVAG